MGQSNATMKQGYCSVPQDVMASYGMTDAEYQAKARAVVARIRAMPNGYASVEDRAAAIDAVLKGTYVVALLCPCVLVCVRVCVCVCFTLLASLLPSGSHRRSCSGDAAMLARVRAALDRWDRDRAATGHPFKSKVA